MKVVIANLDSVYVNISCQESVSRELSEHFTYLTPNYQFNPKYKKGIWDGKIRLYNRKTQNIYRGLIHKIKDFCDDREYEFVYEEEAANEFSAYEAKEFCDSLALPFETREYQLEAFIYAVRNRRAVLRSPTGSGKSLIIYLCSRKFLSMGKKKGLIIVPTINLVNQMYSDFEDYGYDVKSFVHPVYGDLTAKGNTKDTDKPITISTWQSLKEMPASYFESFDFIIGDECHLFKATTLRSIMESMKNADYRLGFTGSLDGTEINKLLIEGLFGKYKVVTDTKTLQDDKHLADLTIKCILLKHPNNIKKLNYEDELKYLILNKSRNLYIRNLALSLEGNTLILYQFVEKQGEVLFDMIKEKAGDRKVFFIHGSVKGDEREAIRKMVEKETNAIIVASYGTFSTGVNIKNLHNVIFASPSKSRVRILQSIGRVLRITSDKTHSTLFDIADELSFINTTLKHFKQRLEIYATEKFKFKIYKVNLTQRD